MVGIERIELLADDERRSLTELVHAIEDARDSERELPVLVAASFIGRGSDLPAALQQSASVGLVEVGPLDTSAVYELACRIAGAKLAPSLGDAVHAVSGGRFDAIVRLVKFGLSAGLLRHGPDGLELATTLARFADEAKDPPGLIETASDPRVARLVTAASCFGTSGALRLLRAPLSGHLFSGVPPALPDTPTTHHFLPHEQTGTDPTRADQNGL